MASIAALHKIGEIEKWELLFFLDTILNSWSSTFPVI